MQALIKRRSTGPACKKTLSRGVNGAPSVVNARRLPGGTVSYNSPTEAVQKTTDREREALMIVR